MENSFLLILIVGAAIYLILSIKVLQEGERLAIFIVGRFKELKGPGLVLTAPGGTAEAIRIELGQEGEIQSNELATFGAVSIPFQAKERVRLGTKVRIAGFEQAAVLVVPLESFIVCEKCGHKNAL